jgi:hypothetical protein
LQDVVLGGVTTTEDAEALRLTPQKHTVALKIESATRRHTNDIIEISSKFRISFLLLNPGSSP